MEDESEIELILTNPLCPEDNSSLEPRSLKIGKADGKGLIIPLTYYCRKCRGYYFEGKIIKDSFEAAKKYCSLSPRAARILLETRDFEFL